MEDRKITVEIDRDILTKIFTQIEESITNKNSSTNININNKENGDKIKLKKVIFNNKNPFLSKIKKIKKESFNNKKNS